MTFDEKIEHAREVVRRPENNEVARQQTPDKPPPATYHQKQVDKERGDTGWSGSGWAGSAWSGRGRER